MTIETHADGPLNPAPIDNDREARAIALRFAIDVQDKTAWLKKDVDPAAITDEILSAAKAFDAFIRRGASS